jgi:hypothetical protein
MVKKNISRKVVKKEVFVSKLIKLPMWCLFLRELNNIKDVNERYTLNITKQINNKYGNSTYTFLVLVRGSLIKEGFITMNKQNGVRKSLLSLTPKGIKASNSINDLLIVVENA